MLADAQALTDNADNPEKVRNNILEVALDYLACGIDPAKSSIFIQSQLPQLYELSFHYMVSGISPTSSKKTVPPLAASSNPTLPVVAPVNAPFS